MVPCSSRNARAVTSAHEPSTLPPCWIKISLSSTCPPATALEVGDSAGAIRVTLSVRKNPQSCEQFLGTSSSSFNPSIRRKAGLESNAGAVPINHQQSVTHTGDDQT